MLNLGNSGATSIEFSVETAQKSFKTKNFKKLLSKVNFFFVHSNFPRLGNDKSDIKKEDLN